MALLAHTVSHELLIGLGSSSARPYLRLRKLLRRAARIFFYIGIAFAVLLVLHVAIVLVCRRLGMPGPPKVLEFPRLELWLALALLQPFGQACGRALSDSPRANVLC